MAALPKLAMPGLRRLERYYVDLEGLAFFAAGTTHVRVRDISYGGARVEFPLHAKTYDAQSIRSLRIAQVLQMRVIWRWSRDRQAGVEFTSPDLARRAVAHLITAQAEKGG